MDTERLRQLLLVMLSSDQPGEITNAAAMVRKLLAKDQLDCHWLTDKLLGTAKPAPDPVWGYSPNPWQQARKPAAQTYKRRFPYIDWQRMLLDVSSQRGILRPKELAFVGSLLEQAALKAQVNPYWQPSDKQMAWLESIYGRLFGDDSSR